MSVLSAIGVGMAVAAAAAFSIYLIDKAVDGRKTAMATLFLFVSCLVAVLFIAAGKSGSERPCVRYETVMKYNVAVKMMMPVSYCAQYGEWVDDRED